MKNIFQIVDRRDPDRELSLTEISQITGAPHPSVYREVQAGLVTTRKIGNTRLVRADTASPYYAGLADVLTRAFGVPRVLAAARLSPALRFGVDL
jgi:hypothetical protein